ncbi:Putative hydrolase [Beauveria bassiana D1-5]|uniref:Putative hydrolase n=1 Tax=Beauveria bassiana D1-5 TaxID=1245745 RepID=A0A0A2WHE8_BEABA|nr:Putative hydrolase [Beauveria bassiana D1-5]
MRYSGAVLAGLAALAQGQQQAPGDAASSFDWDKLPPSTVLSYRPCYDSFECARLTVPMDWKDETNPRLVVLAVIRLPAVVPVSDPAFGGTILTNPGGPGGSGVDSLRGGGGRKLRDALDKPRRAALRDFVERGVGILDGSEPSAVPRILGMYKSFLQKCAAEDEAGTPGAEIMGFMSTPSVARDMVQIVDKIDEHLKEERVELDEGVGENDRVELRKRGHHNEDVPRLQYVGYSYGTILGNYFASLFPERVGRLILDGVVDAKDYSSGPGWITSTVDADNITSHFYTGCHAAGASVCPLVQTSDKSGADIQARVEDYIAALADEPVPITTPGGGFSALTAADVRMAAAITSYSPGTSFKPLAASLADLLAGNATSFVQLLDKIGAFPHLRDACAVGDSIRVPVMQLAVNEASIATRCADGEDVTGRNLTWWRDFVASESRTSKTFGSFWSKIRLPCAGFRFPRHWSFNGPFTTPRYERTSRGRPVRGKPAAPLLFLSSRLDPVTPLRSARRMAAEHPGAAVVVQESMGHCALGSANSECTRGIAREYMDTGKVPSHETVCESDFDPWNQDVDGRASSFVIDAPRFPF